LAWARNTAGIGAPEYGRPFTSSGWLTGTGVALPTVSQTVKEAYIETIVPLLRDASFTKKLDFNGAARVTDYSTFGRVTTWKAGLTWEPVDGLLFRTTRSRDIRAPNLIELYTPRPSRCRCPPIRAEAWPLRPTRPGSLSAAIPA
jgi:outer membrane receptor protein involved in Fe transport